MNMFWQGLDWSTCSTNWHASLKWKREGARERLCWWGWWGYCSLSWVSWRACQVWSKNAQSALIDQWANSGEQQVPPQTWIIGKSTALLRDVEEYFTILYLWKSLPEIPIRAGIVLMQEGLLWFLANGNGGSHAQCQPGCQSTSSGIPSCTSQHRLDRTMWCCWLLLDAVGMWLPETPQQQPP